MKIKNILCIVSMMSLFSCSEFLNVVPDNTPTLDHAFADRVSSERFLFTCYHGLPNHQDNIENPAFLASGEFVCLNSGYMWHNAAWTEVIPDNYRILLNQQNSNNPYANYWDGGMYKNIRTCNIFLENIDKPIDLPEDLKKRWVSEVKFLKAYYHFWLFQMYGPIPIVDTNIPVSATPDIVKTYRDPVDEVVNYIVSLIDEAAVGLPNAISDPLNEMGRITKPAALAIKARVLALAASPLFNGNPDYVGFKDARGIELFPAAYDKEKWKVAADAALEAIKVAEANGHQLYYFNSTRVLNDTTKLKMNIRGSVTDNYNQEIIWGASMGTDGTQRSSLPCLSPDLSQTVNGEMAVTMNVAEQFYSMRGIPIEEDKYYNYLDRNKLRKATRAERFFIREGEVTAEFNFDREIRFYASLAFDRGIVYGAGVLNDTLPSIGATESTTPKFVKGRNTEMSGKRSSECYSITGYNPKKLVHWESSYSSSKQFNTAVYHLPIIRLADLYLLYAEAATEYSDEINSNVYTYLDAIRKRAGLEGVLTSWSKYSTNSDKPQNKAGLLSIIHQERLIELAFEGQRYWDMRRWKTLENYLNEPLRGWNIYGDNVDDYYQVKNVLETSFGRKNYLWPIKQSSIDQNSNLIQNPGW